MADGTDRERLRPAKYGESHSEADVAKAAARDDVVCERITRLSHCPVKDEFPTAPYRDRA